MSTAQSFVSADAAMRLRQLQSLAPLPMVAQKLLQDLEREDLSLAQLAGVIEMDPALTARLMGLSNSAYFAGSTPATSVVDAVGRVLGLDLVKNLALGVVLGGAFDTGRCSAFRAEEFWFKAVASATLSGPLSGLVEGPMERDWVYLGGLLRELGLLALCALCPEEMSRVLGESETGGDTGVDSLAGRVHAALGLTPSEAGAVLARRWRLPEPLAVVMSHCADPGYRGPHWRNSALAGLAGAVALDLYHEREDPDARRPWLRALGVPGAAIGPLVGKYQSRVESLRVLSSHMAAT